MANETQKNVVTRFPPSPTGLFHIGSARTALFNYLYAKKHGGEMMVRFEDTDKERSKPEYEEDAIAALEWLGIYEFQAPVRQSERGEVYKSYTEKLLDSGAAYISKEEKDGVASEIIRFKNPNRNISFQDIIRGDIEFDTSDLGDFVIARSITEPLYHLAVVIDDFEMGVTHIIRGEDHISNTPRQILIQEALGFERPTYAHIPLILGPDKSKLSKRHGATSIMELKKQGYLPDAVFNYLSLLGWHPKDDQEIFTPKELISVFELEDVQKGGAIFSYEKLRWINKEHISRMTGDDFFDLMQGYIPADIELLPGFSKKMLRRIVSVVRERVEVFEDVEKMAKEGDLDYFFESPEYNAEGLVWKNDEDSGGALTHIKFVIAALENIADNNFTISSIKEAVWPYAEREGKGSVLWPMRYALSGRDRSPDPFELAAVFGKEESIKRLERAHDKLSKVR